MVALFRICLKTDKKFKQDNKKESNFDSDSQLVISAGFEPAIAWMRTRSPGPLDDETSLKTSCAPKGG